MSFDVRIHFADASTTTLAIKPVYAATFSEVRGEDATPGPRISLRETWTLETRIRSADSPGDWTTLRALLQNAANPPTQVELRRNGATYHTVGGTGYERFTLEEVDVPAAPGSISSHVPLALRASADRPPSTSRVKRADLAFDYNDAGLATRRWSGEIRTPSGTSAQAQARVLGVLALPGGTWAFTGSNGPEGLNVRVIDGNRDTEATWESVAREYGEAVPGATGSFAHREVTTHDQDGQGNPVLRTTVQAEAAGTGALGYVQSVSPSRFTRSTVTNDIGERRATAEYVIEESDVDLGRNIKRRFVVRGDFRGPLTIYPLTGGAAPVIQRGGSVGWTIIEEISVRGTDIASLADVPVPPPLGVLADHQDGADLVEVILDQEGAAQAPGLDFYVRRVTRVFKINFLPPIPAMLAAVLERESGATPDGGRDALTIGNIGGFAQLGLTGAAGRRPRGFTNIGAGMMV